MIKLRTFRWGDDSVSSRWAHTRVLVRERGMQKSQNWEKIPMMEAEIRERKTERETGDAVLLALKMEEGTLSQRMLDLEKAWRQTLFLSLQGCSPADPS